MGLSINEETGCESLNSCHRQMPLTSQGDERLTPATRTEGRPDFLEGRTETSERGIVVLVNCTGTCWSLKSARFRGVSGSVLSGPSPGAKRQWGKNSGAVTADDHLGTSLGLIPHAPCLRSKIRVNEVSSPTLLDSMDRDNADPPIRDSPVPSYVGPGRAYRGRFPGVCLSRLLCVRFS
jgi:hypothetical protein